MITPETINVANTLAGPDMLGQANGVLSDIRCIIRASDIHSKKLQRLTGLTTAQALVIRAVNELGEVTTRAISDEVALSQATVTTVLDRLEKNGFIERYRSSKDRRIVHARLTEKGEAVATAMPDLLDEKFIARFADLGAERREEISSALALVARMMNADATDAATAVKGRDS
ncbi:MAG: MarR family winged helix-turn-helix transcriptional regulator [Hyphococcus sp.]